MRPNGTTPQTINGKLQLEEKDIDDGLIETTVEEVKPAPDAPPKQRIKRKYRHVAAIHSEPKTSCLSHDSEASPSFVGFRNLMIIVLVVGNLRLMIENYKKVSRASRQFTCAHC